MKIAYKHLVSNIACNPSIDDLSEKLFQLGHEHEIENEIFDIEFTPNRGDCLSVKGLLRDLAVFYEISSTFEIYKNHIDPFDFDFTNNVEDLCHSISFIKIELENLEISKYKNSLKDYFEDFKINKNNFFADISNYISYETGQPIHCYDASKITNLNLKIIQGENNFSTLLDKDIKLTGTNLVFLNNNEIVNLAGIVGGKASACSKETSSVLVECAYFHPEAIIGKNIKYHINSEAGHKFERGVDPNCHEEVLRRFIKIVAEHASIKDVKFFSKTFKQYENSSLLFDCNLINKINGIQISEKEYKNYLIRLGFDIKNNKIIIPSYRSDISTQNDIAEEIARVIGYNNIPAKELKLSEDLGENNFDIKFKLRSLLIDNGFYEVINDSFDSEENDFSIKIDNPLDSQRSYIRTSLKNSLIKNLSYNERRQKDSIKLFEIADIYSSPKLDEKKSVIGIIASGRVAKNYKYFSKKIDKSYLQTIIGEFLPNKKANIEEINRDKLNTKLKNRIAYAELEIKDFLECIHDYNNKSKKPISFIKYKQISEFPQSYRDLSFSIKDYKKMSLLSNLILKYDHKLLKEVYLFDYYVNDKAKEIKAGYRFVFQSKEHTITEAEVTTIIDDIISKTMNIKSISIPGLK